MQLAFALFHYFPYGGLERDMLAIARACLGRGHDVTIYTGSWQGERPADLPVVELGACGRSNHASNADFARRLQRALRERPEAIVVGFNKMPGLHVYYAADTCFAHKAYAERNWLYRLTARCRQFLAMERAVFARESRTEVLMISPAQIGVYQHYYGTPPERLHLLPPGIRRERVMPADYDHQREALRQQYGLPDDQFLLLAVGSGFRAKGLDRSIRALGALPEALRRRCQLWVAGQDKEASFRKLALTLGLERQVRFLGGRDDVSQLLWSADLLLHPAYRENTGTVLLEAMVAGLPVIASAACGYAPYIESYVMGEVLSEPIAPDSMAAAIERLLDADPEQWRHRGRTFADSADIFSMPRRAAELIEQLWGGR